MGDSLNSSATNNSAHDASVEELGISRPTNKLQRWANKLDSIVGVEARGIERIPDEMRDREMTIGDYIHMFTM
jgi:hypothetical protein